MKKIISLIFALLFCCSVLFAQYKVTVKGEVYRKTVDGEVIQLKETDTIEDDDTLIVGEKSSVTLYVEDNKIVIRAAGVYKVEKVVK